MPHLSKIDQAIATRLADVLGDRKAPGQIVYRLRASGLSPAPGLSDADTMRCWKAAVTLSHSKHGPDVTAMMIASETGLPVVHLRKAIVALLDAPLVGDTSEPLSDGNQLDVIAGTMLDGEASFMRALVEGALHSDDQRYEDDYNAAGLAVTVATDILQMAHEVETADGLPRSSYEKGEALSIVTGEAPEALTAAYDEVGSLFAKESLSVVVPKLFDEAPLTVLAHMVKAAVPLVDSLQWFDDPYWVRVANVSLGVLVLWETQARRVAALPPAQRVAAIARLAEEEQP